MLVIAATGQEKLAQLFSERCPERKKLRIVRFEEIPEGWETDIFRCTLKYEERGRPETEDLVLRFYHGLDPVAQATKDFAVMGRLRRVLIPVPRVNLLVEETDLIGAPLVAMERIQGATLAEVLEKATAEEKDGQLAAMMANLVALHRVLPERVFNQARSGASSDPLDYVGVQLDQMRHTADFFGLREFQPLLAWLEARRAQGANDGLVVLHNDYHPRNILVRQRGGGQVIIDWSFAGLGDYRLDLTWTTLLVGVALGSKTRQQILSLYEEISGKEVRHFRYFEVLKFTQRMLTIATWLDTRVQIPVKKITREAIRGDYKVHVLNVYHRLKAITGLELPTIEAL